MIHRAGHQRGNRKHFTQLAFYSKFYSNVAVSQCYVTCLCSSHSSASEQPTRRRASHRLLIVARWDPRLSFRASSRGLFVRGHNLFREANSFSKSVARGCELRGVYLGVRACELFLCFVAIVRVRVYYVDFFVFFVLRQW